MREAATVRALALHEREPRTLLVSAGGGQLELSEPIELRPIGAVVAALESPDARGDRLLGDA